MSGCPKTMFAKLWMSHRVVTIDAVTDLIAIDRVLLHDRTGSVALKGLMEAGREVLDRAQAFAFMDHVVDTRPGRTDETVMPGGRAFITQTRAAARANGIGLFDLGDPSQGIVHVVSPEQGIVLPGLTLVCPDSHTGTQGALGALAWGIGSTEAEHALATGTLRVRRPHTMRITVSDRLAAGVTAKDLALAIIGRLGAGGGSGHAIEFAGEAVDAMDIEARLTLCNMATELSAFCAIVAPDDRTFAYLKGRPRAPVGRDWDRAVGQWRRLGSDTGAMFDSEHIIDAASIAPTVTWGTSPQQAIAIDGTVPALEDSPHDSAESHRRALTYMDLVPGQPLVGLTIDAAFIGSCTNSRLSDLRAAAAVLEGRKVAAGVKAICVPGSTQVKRAAESEGIDRIFVDAGFEWRESGCSMCFFSGGESFGPQARVISSTNRNFESRQGPQTRSHLAAPRDRRSLGDRRADRRPARPRSMSAVPVTRLTGLVAPLMRDNVNTDAIIPSREMKSVSRTGLADGLFADWRYTKVGGRVPAADFVLNDPRFSQASILLAGSNFGCGSSREHAAWALAEFGIRAVIAESFNPIFRGNAVLNGIIPVILPRASIDELGREILALEQGTECTVDLDDMAVECRWGPPIPFALDEAARTMLREGLDMIDLTLRDRDAIEAFRNADRRVRPWAYAE